MLRGVAQWVRFAEIEGVVRGVVGGLELPGERVGYDWVIGVFAHCGPPYRGAVVRGRDVCGAPNEAKCGILIREWGKIFLFFGLGEVREERAVCASNVGD